MKVRNCAGGIVFCDGCVFLLKNEKDQWVMPKGVVRDRRDTREVALERVQIEAGIQARIVETVGASAYEFYSMTRHDTVNNKIVWYLMETDEKKYRIAFEQGFTDGDFYPVQEAVAMVTHEQDRELLRKAIEQMQKKDA